MLFYFMIIINQILVILPTNMVRVNTAVNYRCIHTKLKMTKKSRHKPANGE